MTFLGFTGLVNFLCSAALGIFVYQKCPRRAVGISYAILNLTIACFSAFYFFWQCSSTAHWGFFHLRMLTVSAIWINQGLMYFNSVFFGMTPRRRKALWFAALLNILFSIFNFTSVMYSHVVPRYGLGYWPLSVTGWFVLYLLWWHTELLYAFVDMIRSHRTLEGHKRDQVAYMITAFAIGYIGGITNWPMWFGVHLPPYANILISVYILIVAYAIVKHRLLDMTIIIRRTLIYSIITATLAVVYMTLILLSAHIFERMVVNSQLWGALLAATVTTLFFLPLRNRVQQWVDRQFPRERLDPGLLQEAAGGFAHEMKRPLSKISLPAELALLDLARLRTGELSLEEGLTKMEERLKFIMHQSVDAGYMIEAIRELSASSASTFVPVDLRRVMDSALNMEQERLEKHGILVHQSLSFDLPMVPGHARQLEIVFINLIKNAAESMSSMSTDKRRELHIEGNPSESGIEIRLRDTGPGIRREDMANIFQPQYSTKGSRGTGMGLYLSSQIIQVHGGSIGVDTEGNGTAFVIHLPKKR